MTDTTRLVLYESLPQIALPATVGDAVPPSPWSGAVGARSTRAVISRNRLHFASATTEKAGSFAHSRGARSLAGADRAIIANERVTLAA